jgi:uncharacterized protein involved in response to NO
MSLSTVSSIGEPGVPAAPRFALFEYGFRPFFLLVGLSGASTVALWLAIYFGALALPSDWPAPVWHAHEMLFGFAVAGVAGFMLTAVPNWTGAAPVRGARLVVLVLLWLAGRAALWLAGTLPAPLVAATDLAFHPRLPATLAPALIAQARRTGPRNLVFLVLLALLETANFLTHLEALDLADNMAMPGLYLGIFVLTLMIALVGGRIIPAFTTNALRARGETALPRSHGAIEAVAIGAIAAFVVAQLAGAPGVLAGAIGLIAALANLCRLALWRSPATLHQPMLWVLHLGYLWLVAGLALSGAAALTEAVPPSAALHALTVGAVGTMLLAVMSRAALGHTGRRLEAHPATVAAYLLVSLAALLRIAGTLLPEALLVSGLAWSAAFALFLVVYAPILIGRREDGRPG